MPQIQGVIVSINADGEKERTTFKALESQANSFSVPIVPTGVNGYSWTAGLNAGIAITNEISLDAGIDTKNIHLFNMSFDVDFTQEELGKLNEAIEVQRYIVTARKFGDDSQKGKYENTETVRKKLQKAVRSPLE